jgi:hypothetical protein
VETSVRVQGLYIPPPRAARTMLGKGLDHVGVLRSVGKEDEWSSRNLAKSRNLSPCAVVVSVTSRPTSSEQSLRGSISKG